jgi:hypothetical protein
MTAPNLFVMSSAVISPCGRWRYKLVRQWDDTLFTAVFIMLNPSTADSTTDDPTIRKCMGFARHNNCGGIEVYNLFAYRCSKPQSLAVLSHNERIGPENDDYLCAINRYSGKLIYAWGNSMERYPWFKERVEEIRNLFSFRPAWCVKQSEGKQPWHPLYVPYGEFQAEGIFTLVQNSTR